VGEAAAALAALVAEGDISDSARTRLGARLTPGATEGADCWRGWIASSRRARAFRWGPIAWLGWMGAAEAAELARRQLARLCVARGR